MKRTNEQRRRGLWKRAYSAERAASYERLIRESVGPTYRAILDTVDETLRLLGSRRQPRILDLGTGTGNLLLRLRETTPATLLVGVDGSAPMLEVARRRLGANSGVSLHERDFSSSDWRTGLGRFDAVVSTGAIHHLNPAGKRRLFRDIFEVLRPGGLFVCGDPLKGASPRLELAYEDAWVALIQRNIARAGGHSLPSRAIRTRIRTIQRREGDMPDPLDEQLSWLRRAGFRDVDCHWKSFGFAVFGGTRPRN